MLRVSGGGAGKTGSPLPTEIGASIPRLLRLILGLFLFFCRFCFFYFHPKLRFRVPSRATDLAAVHALFGTYIFHSPWCDTCHPLAQGFVPAR